MLLPMLLLVSLTLQEEAAAAVAATTTAAATARADKGAKIPGGLDHILNWIMDSKNVVR